MNTVRHSSNYLVVEAGSSDVSIGVEPTANDFIEFVLAIPEATTIGGVWLADGSRAAIASPRRSYWRKPFQLFGVRQSPG